MQESLNTSTLVVSFLFGLYALVSALDYGLVYKMLTGKNKSWRAAAFLSSASALALITASAALAILFSGVLQLLGHKILATLAVALIAMLVRASLVLATFYTRSFEAAPRWLLWLFALCTLLAPMGMTAAGVYLLTGRPFWQSSLGIVLEGSALVGLSAAGLLIFDRTKSATAQLPARLLAAVWLLLVGCVLPLVSLHTGDNLAHLPLAILSLGVLGGLGLIMLNFVLHSLKNLIWQYVALLTVCMPILLAWANHPYLVAHKLTLAEAYGVKTYGSAVLTWLAVLIPLSLAGFLLFVKLFGGLSLLNLKTEARPK